MSLTRTTVGIEISPQQVRVVVAQHGAGRVRVLGASSFERSGDDLRQTSLAVKRFLKQFPGLREARFCLALPSTFVRILDLPATDAATLSQMIPFELERHIPFPIDQVKIDHCVLNDSRDGMTRALVAVVRQEELEPIIPLMQQIAPHRATCTLSSLAAVEFVTRGMHSGRAEEGMVVVEAGPSQTTITISNGGDAFLTRTTGQLTPEQLAAEIRRSAGGFHALFRGVNVRRCIVTGARARDIVSAIDERVSIPVEVMEPWAAMEPPPLFDDDPQRYLVATAAALREQSSTLSVNLLKSQQVFHHTHRQRTHWALAATVALALILGGSYRSFLCALHAKEAELARVELRVQRLQKSAAPATAGHREPSSVRRSPILAASRESGRRSLITESQLIEHLARNSRRSSYTWLETLRVLSARLPDKVWLSELACEKDNQVILNGTAPTNADVAAALQVLEKTGFYSDVRLVHSRVTDVRGKEGFDFQIACAMNANNQKESR